MFELKLILGQITLKDLGIDLRHLSKYLPKSQLHQYIAAEHWLSDSTVDNESSASQHVKGYLQAIQHLCEAQDCEAAIQILKARIESSVSRVPPLPLYYYLIYKGLARQLLQTTEIILNSFQGSKTDQCFLEMLKAIALESLGQRSDALKIYQDICDGLLPQSKEYLEALSRLAGCQIQMGNYEAGIPNLENALSLIETLSQTQPDSQLTELKTELLENLAFYRMNTGRFDEAFNLFGEVFNLREQNQLVIGQVQPLAHQGILLRKSAAPRQYIAMLLVVNSLRLLKLNWLATPLEAQLCQPFMLRIAQNYERAEELLRQAYRLCEELKDENAASWIAHHIAWVTINRGQAAAAEEYARIALEQYERSEDQRGISDCHEQLGRIYLAKGRQYLDEAEYHFNQSLTIRQSIRNLHGMASSILNFAFLYWHKGNYLQSIRYLVQGMQGYRKIHLLSFSRVLAILTLFSVWTAGNRDWTT